VEEGGWHAQRGVIEGKPFRAGGHDVVHFTTPAQWAAWAQLAVAEGNGAVEAYLRTLAPEGMLYIPAGAFLMGSPEDDPDARDDERPQHELWLRGYYIDRYPVTNGQYREFVDAGGYQQQAYWTAAGWAAKEREGWQAPHFWLDEQYNGERQPVVGVSWYEAVAYARWAGKALPSEAEWEKAASWDPVAGCKRRYPWGDDWDAAKCECGNRHERALEVGSNPEDVSPYGLCDVAGNVIELLSSRREDERGPRYGLPYQPEDGREILEGSHTRMCKSTCWKTDEYSARGWAQCSSRHDWTDNLVRYEARGFRCVVPHTFSLPEIE
jgi:formylglycine-generating enzyme required for sulfatase activity